MAEDPLDLVGVTLDGRFRVDSLVDDGGLNLSYRGLDMTSHVPVAVRCLNLPTTLDAALAGPFVDSFNERTQRHARLGAGHPVFVKLLASGHTKAPTTGLEVPYEVREWLEAITLHAYIVKHSTKDAAAWPIDFVLAALDPVADGLVYSHAMGVIHGAVNPNNLVVVEGGSRPTVRITDFGDARSEDTGSLRPVLRVLEPEYTAPEQVDKQLGAIGPWTDVFALAVIVLECLAGSLAGSGKAASVLVEPKNRPTPKKLGLDLSARVEEVLDRALAIDPEDRPSDVATFWADLKTAASPVKKLLPTPPALPKASVSPSQPRVSSAPRGASKPPLPPRAPGNALVKATLLGIQPQKLPTAVSPGLPANAKPFFPASVPPPSFSEDEAPTKKRDGLASQPDIPPSLPPPAAPVSSIPPPPEPFPTTATASLEEPDVFVPALGPPSIFVRLKGAAKHGGHLARIAWNHSRTWTLKRGLPWVVARAKDERPRARVAFFGATALGGFVFLSVFLSLCLPRSRSKAVSAAAATTASASTASATIPSASSNPTPPALGNIPPPPPVQDTPLEIAPDVPKAPASAAPAVAFTKVAANAALEAAGADLSDCKQLGTLRGPGSIRVSFNKAGAVAKITMGPPYADTPEGACILDRFGRAQMAPLRGTGGTVNYTFNVPK
jgi:serine/threonine protein kinase